MARRRRSGRRRDPNAKRRQSTRAGRAGALDEVVTVLKSRRKRVSTRADLGETAIDILLGRGIIDQAAHDAGLHLARLLEIHRRYRWLSSTSVAVLWNRPLAGSSDGPAPPASGGDPDRATIGDLAGRELKRLYRTLGREHYACVTTIVADLPLACIAHLVAGDGVYGRHPAPVLVSGVVAPAFDAMLKLISAATSRRSPTSARTMGRRSGRCVVSLSSSVASWACSPERWLPLTAASSKR